MLNLLKNSGIFISSVTTKIGRLFESSAKSPGGSRQSRPRRFAQARRDEHLPRPIGRVHRACSRRHPVGDRVSDGAAIFQVGRTAGIRTAGRALYPDGREFRSAIRSVYSRRCASVRRSNPDGPVSIRLLFRGSPGAPQGASGIGLDTFCIGRSSRGFREAGA